MRPPLTRHNALYLRPTYRTPQTFPPIHRMQQWKRSPIPRRIHPRRIHRIRYRRPLVWNRQRKQDRARLQKERDEAMIAAARAADHLAKLRPGQSSALYVNAMRLFAEGKPPPPSKASSSATKSEAQSSQESPSKPPARITKFQEIPTAASSSNSPTKAPARR